MQGQQACRGGLTASALVTSCFGNTPITTNTPHYG